MASNPTGAIPLQRGIREAALRGIARVGECQDGGVMTAGSGVSREVVGWIEAVEEFSEVLRCGEPSEIIRGFTEVVQRMTGAVGLSVVLSGESDRTSSAAISGRSMVAGDAESGLPHTGGGVDRGPLKASRGIPLPLVVRLELLDEGLPVSALRRWTVRDTRECSEFRGTLVLGLLEELGVRAVQSIPLVDPSHRVIGLATVLLPRTGEIPSPVERAVHLVSAWTQAALTHRAVVRESTQHADYFSAVLEAASDGIVGIDDRGIIRSANPAAERMFGFGPGGLIGVEISAIVRHPPRSRSLLSRAGACADSAFGMPQEVEGVRRDESVYPIELTLNPIRTMGGFTAIMRDISGRKTAEATLCDQDRLAVIGTLAAGLGHDLNNVLFPIRAHLNALSAPTGRLTAARRGTHVTAIRSSIGYLQHLADSLHALALDPDGDGDGESTTDLAAWWRQAGTLLSKALHRRADLEVRIGADLPVVAVPPHSLTRAVLNLLVNAADAMPDDRPKDKGRVLLRCDASHDRKWIELEIRDNGIGMTEETRRRAFDMFYTTKIRGLGTGLGLPLVRRVVERAGGSVEIDSEIGRGTSVKLYLPRARAGGTVRPTAAVRVEDGRLRALVEGYLVSFGAELDGALALDEVDLLVIDTSAGDDQLVDRWTAVHPPQTLVLIGPLSATDQFRLRRIGVTLLTDSTDIAAIERGLGDAMDITMQEESNV